MTSAKSSCSSKVLRGKENALADVAELLIASKKNQAFKGEEGDE
jgi:hypothetical protein